jgi:hypothetical protein
MPLRAKEARKHFEIVCYKNIYNQAVNYTRRPPATPGNITTALKRLDTNADPITTATLKLPLMDIKKIQRGGVGQDYFWLNENNRPSSCDPNSVASKMQISSRVSSQCFDMWPIPS